MTKVRDRGPVSAEGARAAGPPPDSALPDGGITPTALDVCLRACAVHSGKLVGSLDRRRTQLSEAIRQLLVVQVAEQTPPAPARTGGGTASLFRRPARSGAPAGGIPGPLLDALLAVGSKALECGYDDELRLARLVSDTVLTQRKNSRAGWRLRARTCEALGQEAAAVEAYEKYLTLVKEDGFGVRAKIAGLRAGTALQEDLLRLLRSQCPASEAYAAGPATDVWESGLELNTRGEWEQAEPRLVGALLALSRESGHPVQELQRTLSQYLDLRIAAGTRGADGLREVLGLYAEQRRNRMRGPVADPTFDDVTWLTLGEFRNQIAGKSVCLIANSQKVGESTMGEEIDSYDLVVRFNSYRIDPKATGRRTDVHATIHKHGFNWDQFVPTRLVYGGVSGDWKHSLRNRLVPGAQRHLGDESLRWPLRNIGKVGADAWPGIPTTGFNTLWLLDFLDVSPRLDLIGFDFYSSGAYRLPEAMSQPITAVHEYISEKAWVMERAQRVTDMRISLR